MDLFALATRNQWRWVSTKGLLDAEALWQLPLTARDGFSLNEVAKNTNAELKAMAEESFVAEKPVPGRQSAEQRLEIVKFVIATKLAENEAARAAIAKREEKQKLLALLDDKNNEALKGLSADELKLRIAALD